MNCLKFQFPVVKNFGRVGLTGPSRMYSDVNVKAAPRVKNYLTFTGNKQKPYYLEKLPFYKKYPKGFAFIGVILTLGTVFSSFIWRCIISPPTDRNDPATWWKHEQVAGKRNHEIVREHLLANKAAKEARKAAAKAAKAEATAAAQATA